VCVCVCSGDEIPIRHLSGYELTCEYLEHQGFDVPIIVDRTEGLDMQVPPPTFTVQDVENCVGRYHVISKNRDGHWSGCIDLGCHTRLKIEMLDMEIDDDLGHTFVINFLKDRPLS